MSSTPKDRLIDFLAIKKIGRNKFEDACNLSHGYVNNMKGNITATTINKIISVYPELNPSWLAFGIGDMLISGEKPQEEIKGMSTAYFHDNLHATAGDGEQPQIFNEEPTGSIRLPDLHGAKHFFPVVGCSMSPRIKPGDYISVTDECIIASTIDPDKVYLIITNDNQRMIKHIEEVDKENGTITCLSENMNYKPFRLGFEEIFKIYQVIFHLEMI